jgi:hypothetical protein
MPCPRRQAAERGIRAIESAPQRLEVSLGLPSRAFVFWATRTCQV